MKLKNYLLSIATIGAAHYCIKEAMRKLNNPRSPIYRIVDRATGYDKNKDIKESVIEYIKTIIKEKKKIGLNISDDKKTLKDLKAL